MSESWMRENERHRPDEQALEVVIGPQLVARFYGLLRAVRVYDLSNQTVGNQIRETMGLLEQVMEDELTLVAMGQCFYLNGVRVRAEPSQIPFFDALTGEFDQRRLGGVRFLNGLRAEELAAFLRLMVEHADASRGAKLAEAAAGAGVMHVVPITLEELEALRAEEGPSAAEDDQSERGRARRVFQQAIQGAKGAILRTARTGRPAIRRVKRLVQPIVDSIMKNEYSIVGLTAMKNHDEYTYVHCVNVSILSVAIGQTLGFSRSELANLGVAALLHDVGKLAIPVEVLAKPDLLSETEWRLMRRHPIEGVRMVALMPGLSSLMLDALGVCLHHHLTYDRGGYPSIARDWRLSAKTRIVSVADCYDAMTAHRAYRDRPFTGYEALRQLVAQERRQFDPAVLWGLVNTVGLYPAGTLLQTRSGYLVLSLTNDRENLRRPHCRVLARPDGTHVLEGRPEIWAPMPGHETVARVVPPEEFEVEIDRLLAA